MQKEQEQGKLKEQVGNTFGDLLKKNSSLARSVEEAFASGDFDPTEFAAALHLIEGMSRATREVVESGKEHVIFSRNQHLVDEPLYQDGQQETQLEEKLVDLSQKPEGVLVEHQDTEEQQKQPKTFGELLALKLGQRLPEKLEFTREELERFTGSIRGSKEIMSSQRGITFSREKTLEILQKVLTTPGKMLDRTGEFGRKRILRNFPLMRVSDFDEWSFAVGHDWNKTPEVSFEKAMQIRGLFMLEKLNLPPKTPLPAA